MAFVNHFDILGEQDTSSRVELRRAYDQRMTAALREFGNAPHQFPAYVARGNELHLAHHTLTNEEARLAYFDAFGAELREYFAPGELHQLVRRLPVDDNERGVRFVSPPMPPDPWPQAVLETHRRVLPFMTRYKDAAALVRNAHGRANIQNRVIAGFEELDRLHDVLTIELARLNEMRHGWEEQPAPAANDGNAGVPLLPGHIEPVGLARDPPEVPNPDAPQAAGLIDEAEEEDNPPAYDA